MGSGSMSTFCNNLLHTHFNVPCRGIEYQSEVALLSRSVLLEGPDGAQDTKLGAHVLIHGQVGTWFDLVLRLCIILF